MILKKYEDPVAHFREVAKQMNKEEIKELTIKNLNNKTIDNSSKSKNLGYVALREIYKELGLDEFINQKNKNLKIKYSLKNLFPTYIFQNYVPQF